MDKKLLQYVMRGDLSRAEALIAKDMLSGKTPLTQHMANLLAVCVLRESEIHA